MRYIITFISFLYILTIPLNGQKKISTDHRISRLEDSVNTLRSEITSLQSTLNFLWEDYFSFKSDHNADLDPVFDPAENNVFQPLRDRYITLLVSIKSVEQYLDGYKVIFKFGNITSAALSGFSLKITWGPKIPDGYIGYSDWLKKCEIREFTFTNILSPGIWTPISVNLVPAPQQDFRYIKLQLKTSVVGLN